MAKCPSREKVARILVLFGVSAWLPYAVLHYILKIEISITPFLIWHLCGVIPGTIIKYFPRLQKRYKQQ